VLGIEFVPNIPLDELISHAVLAEECGFDAVWVTDHYNNRNVYVALSLLAEKTKKVKLGPGATNPYHIHPALTASAVASLDEASGGRAMLGVGAGDETTLASIGIHREKPVARLKEAVKVIRCLLTGERVTFNGEFFKLNGAQLTCPAPKIPIYIGAQGPRMLETAGLIGDGVLINASHPLDFEYAIPRLKHAKKNFDIAAYTSFSVDLDEKKAKEAVLPIVAYIVAGTPKFVLERHGISPEGALSIKDALVRGDFRAAFASVTDQMIDAFSIYGSPEHCLQRIHELYELGVTQVVIGSPIGPDKSVAIETIGREIVPSLKKK